MFNKPASTENNTTVVPPTLAAQPTASEPTLTMPPPQQSSKKLLLIVSAVVLLLAAAVGVFAMMQRPPVDNWPQQQEPIVTPQSTPAPTEEAVFCTMDAKICPDGSSVRRVPPSCEFEACPGETSETQTYTNQKMGFQLNLPEDWPTLNAVESEGAVAFNLTLQESEFHSEQTAFTIIETDSSQDMKRLFGTVLATKQNGKILACVHPLDTIIQSGTVDEENWKKIYNGTEPCSTVIPTAFSVL